MRKLVSVLTFLIVSSCKQDCYQTITGVKLQGSKEFGEHTTEVQFMNKTIILNANMEVEQRYFHFPKRCNDPLIKNNLIIDSTLKLLCDKDLFLITDTLISKTTNLIDCFEVFNKVEGRDQFISFRNKQLFSNQSGFYTFYFSGKLSNGIEISDSCTLKIDF